ncbi:hypothetical protein BSLG_010840 [Batrachochytrium salamandrivorans]|nr:hypothetical protein BSLG_010840 [Batrachochytrium salamandrivorans]
MFVPALTLILALASTTVIAVPMANNVYKRSAASLDSSSTELPFYFPKSSMKAFSHISNHQAAAHVKNGEATFFSTSFGTEQHLAKRDLVVSAAKTTLSFEEVSSTVSTQLKIPVYSEFAYTLEWVQVWCDTTTGEVVQAINFSNKVSYIVIGLPHRDPTDGLSWLVGPSTKKPTRRTWTDGKATEGNNAIALGPNGKTTRSIRKSVFYTKFNSQEDPGSAANIAAAAVNLFYITNTMHDISYHMASLKVLKLPKNNFGLGGRAMTLSLLMFLTLPILIMPVSSPPDGQPGVMNMYRYTRSTPNRNPGLDNGAVIHEYAHGISHRLTGGPATSWCLNKGEARGMGEGWSDIISMIVLAKSSDTATTGIAISAYSTNHPEGIREVWATMLWEVYWNLVTKHGFATNLHDANQSAGNIVALKIIMGGLTLQPCNPTFLVPTSEIYKDLPSVALALGPPTPAQMTFRFHLNVSSDSAPVSYDGISHHIKHHLTTKGYYTLVNINCSSR